MHLYRSRMCRAHVLLIVFLSGAACTTWRVEPLTPEMLQNRPPQQLKITRLDGAVVLLDSAQIRGDTVIGNRQSQEVRIPLDSVQQTTTRRASAGKSLGLVLGIGAGVLVAYAIVHSIACGNNACTN